MAPKASKTAAISDLRNAVIGLNSELEKTKRLSADVLTNMQKTSKSSGGKDSANPMGFPAASAIPVGPPKLSGTNPTNPAGAAAAAGAPPATGGGVPGRYITGPGGFVAPMPGAGGGGTGASGSGGGGGDGWKATALAITSAIGSATDPAKYITNDIARRTFGFYTGRPGEIAGGQMAQSMMKAGTGTSPFDAINAMMAGNSMGLMNGLQNYSTIAGSAATFSNLMPGVGLEGGMQATGALNRGKSVNMLRMIGINVRDDNGLMRSFDAIANDLWAILKRTKRDGGPITTEELSFSLQPGNSLDMMLNQYFGNDPILRQGVIKALFQKAQGGNFSKESMKQTGANPAISQSIGERNAAEYNLTNQVTNAGVNGVIGSNTIISAVTNLTASIDKLTGIFAAVTGSSTFIQNIMGTGPGQVIGQLIGKLFGGGGDGVSSGDPGANHGPYGMGGGEGSGVTANASGGDNVASPVDNYQSKVTSSWKQIRRIKDPSSGKMVTTKPHGGMDIGVKEGTAVKSVKDGTVLKVGNNSKGFGKYVVVQHNDGLQTLYAHLKQPIVGENDKITAGQKIGLSGNTGFSDGPHLHFQVQKTLDEGNNWKTLDPAAYLAGAKNLGASSGESEAVSDTPVEAPDNSLFGADWNKGNSLFSTPLTTEQSSTGGMGGGRGGADGPGVSMTPTRASLGGVTVHINVQGGSFNEEKLAREVKRVLQEDEQVRMAVTR